MGKNSGDLVQFTNLDNVVVTGRTYHNKPTINGKIAVYVDGKDRPRLVSSDKLKVIGFVD